MKKNLGLIDRVLRIIIGLGLVSTFFLLDGNAKYISLIGVVLIATSVVSFCPIYKLLGIKTNPAKK